MIRTLAASALDLDTENITVRFLADGANHKVYDIQLSDASPHTTSYLFRVAIPIDPTFKLESEVATLKFLKQRTTIPVPKPIAWKSSAYNTLGYEWAVVEKFPASSCERFGTRSDGTRKMR